MSDKLPSEQWAEMGYAIRVYSTSPDEEVWRMNGYHFRLPAGAVIGLHVAKFEDIQEALKDAK